eukprot:SAG22_NODE_865_length_6783_cov_23.880461_2_plen_1099_part_00
MGANPCAPRNCPPSPPVPHSDRSAGGECTVKVPPPPPPADGGARPPPPPPRRPHTGETCAVTCDSGYTGSDSITCRGAAPGSSEWTALACSPAPCTAKRVAHSDHAACTGNRPCAAACTGNFGDKCTVSCDAGYRSDGQLSKELTCGADHRFTAMADCASVPCDPPAKGSIPNGAVSGGGGSYPGTAITVTCKAGYIISSADPATNQCTVADGDPKTATCQCQPDGVYARVACFDKRCFNCDPGKECPADKDSACELDDCVPCQPGHWTKGFGAPCEECRHPNVIKGHDRSTCEVCPPGHGPNKDHTTCALCQAGQYSTYGSCQECPGTQVPDANQTSCKEPFKCPAGMECKTGLCKDTTTCTKCSPGWVSASAGAPCSQCGDQRAANSKNTDCIKCDPGQQPTANQDNCSACSNGTQYSEDGYECKDCHAPYVIAKCDGSVCTKDHTRCTACPAGKGPAKNRTDCTSCIGNTVSQPDTPICHECPVGKVPDDKHTSCGACPHNEDNVGDGHCGCAPGFYNTSARILVCFSYGYNQAELNAVGNVLESEPCQDCPRCADCSHGNITIKAGWRMIPESDGSQPKQVGMAFACDMTDADDQNNEESTVAQARCPGIKLTHGYTDFDGCAENYTGFMCNSCKEDYHRPAVSGLCEECASADLRYRIISGCLWLSALLVATAAVAWWNRRAIQTRSRQIRTLIKTRNSRAPSVAARDNGSADNDTLEESPQDGDDSLQAHLTRQPEPSRKKVWPRRWALLMAGLSTPVRILVTYVQVVGQLTGKSGALSVKYPKLFTGALQYFAPVADVSRWLGEVFSADCNGMSSFRAKFFLKVVGLPLFLFAIVLALYFLERCVHAGLKDVERAAAHQQLREALMQRMFFAVFFSYPSVCTMVFSSFNCVDVSAGSAQRILVDDDRVYCGDQTHQHIQYLSLLVILVVAVGVPLFFGVWIATKARKFERSKQNPKQQQAVLTPVDMHRQSQSLETLAVCALADNWGEPLANPQLTPGDQCLEEMEAVIRDVTVLSDFSILIGAYRPSVAYWETVDMLRKLALVGLVVLVGRGSVAQVAAGTVLSFGFFALHVKVREQYMLLVVLLLTCCY